MIFMLTFILHSIKDKKALVGAIHSAVSNKNTIHQTFSQNFICVFSPHDESCGYNSFITLIDAIKIQGRLNQASMPGHTRAV